MKKILAILLASAVSVGTVAFVGCGDNSSGDSGYGSEVTKPTMPTTSDMQTVAAEDAYEECVAIRKKMVANCFGSYQAYAFSEENTSYDGRFRENDTENYVAAKYTEKFVQEAADNYVGKKDTGSNKAALTHHRSYFRDEKTDSTNPQLAYINSYEDSKYIVTGVQTNSQLYTFQTNDLYGKGGDGEEQTIKSDRVLVCYEDGINPDKAISGSIIPVSYAVDKVFEDGLAYGSFIKHLRMASEYSVNGQSMNLMDDDEYYGSVDVTNFTLTAKKSENKFYASVKYTLEFVPNYGTGDGKSKIDHEYSILIDLGKPDGELPTAGININDISLSKYAENMAYLDLTSEQITVAVEQGNGMVLPIKGNGNLENFEVYFNYRNPYSIENRQVSIDCGPIKESIEELKTAYQDNYEVGIACLSYSYTDEDNYIWFKAILHINY